MWVVFRGACVITWRAGWALNKLGGGNVEQRREVLLTTVVSCVNGRQIYSLVLRRSCPPSSIPPFNLVCGKVRDESGSGNGAMLMEMPRGEGARFVDKEAFESD
ncbi:uncharacterized protein LACBIDRAFT_314687 [Laccaria bicolor S238N-H82]|uniref:Predicted protein n=1 Tax=Laccaria bicolor (strain S238N-H82 / ATCC MYA-4686) TaxID=486041 RepID=B0DZ11_LACBS|nr:uncharacterized protein LACBIDRAFT_314687 [Laccaria bicolor S238N-H82]EDR00150.1 predicted protein [Laccaria bicolor S238N-H82]|eukprot:XP_001889207.1 predicted protein [Laccaria bicolor S238N-H82]